MLKSNEVSGSYHISHGKRGIGEVIEDAEERIQDRYSCDRQTSADSQMDEAGCS